MVSGSGFNKKGASLGLFELILGVTIFFIVGVAWLVTNNMSTDINSYLLEDEFFNEGEGKDALLKLEDDKTSMFNGGFALFIIGIFTLGAISSWYALSNPVFFVMIILLMSIILIIPVFLGDAWEDVSEEMGGNSLSFMNFVLNNQFIFSLVFVFMCIGIMFFKGNYLD